MLDAATECSVGRVDYLRQKSSQRLRVWQEAATKHKTRRTGQAPEYGRGARRCSSVERSLAASGSLGGGCLCVPRHSPRGKGVGDAPGAAFTRMTQLSLRLRPVTALRGDGAQEKPVHADASRPFPVPPQGAPHEGRRVPCGDLPLRVQLRRVRGGPPLLGTGRQRWSNPSRVFGLSDAKTRRTRLR